MTVTRREAFLVLMIAIATTVLMTWPMVPKIDRLGRTDNGDGNLSLWNVAWVSRTLVTDPLHVFDANIFYPHRATLTYSESNLGAGILGIPGYWATKNAFVAHNSALLIGFVLTFLGMYGLVRYLTEDRYAAAISAIGFAFTPFLFAHSPHIQLLMTSGLPLSMLAFHRFVDRTTPARGAVLGVAMAWSALCCGYYGIFVILMVGYATLVVAIVRAQWREPRYWLGLVTGALVACVLVAPAFLPYLSLQHDEGFTRTLEEAGRYSSNWSDYFTSSSYGHAWMLQYLPRWMEVLFPGFVMSFFGLAGFIAGGTRRRGELLAMYGGLAVLACWASFGPAGGLYTVFYKAVPIFAWLRAPARFGLIVAFALSVLAGSTLARLFRALPNAAMPVALALGLVTTAELVVPSNLREYGGFEPVYKTLATLPPGPIIELPFYYVSGMRPLHARYMLNSTTHWMPMVNGYSDYIPPDILDNILTIAAFPSRASLDVLKPRQVRYALFHLYGYNDENRRDVESCLSELHDYFRVLYDGEGTRLYEIVMEPPPSVPSCTWAIGAD
jgi:hypothetical protein